MFLYFSGFNDFSSFFCIGGFAGLSGFFLFFLTEQQDVGEQVGAEQCAKSLTENNHRRENIDDDEYHGKVYDSHNNCAEQKAHAKHDGVFEHCSDGVVKAGEQREDIHQNDGIRSCSDEKNSRGNSPEGIFKAHVIKYITVNSENDTHGKKD